jgi:hypothetical protein
VHRRDPGSDNALLWNHNALPELGCEYSKRVRWVLYIYLVWALCVCIIQRVWRSRSS